jgi:hypothetical protein
MIDSFFLYGISQTMIIANDRFPNVSSEADLEAEESGCVS